MLPILYAAPILCAALVASPRSPSPLAARAAPRAPHPLAKAVGPLDTLTSGLASIARLPYGTEVANALRAAPASDTARHLTLYEFEGCPFCRRVREVVTYLDLTVTVKPCATGSRHRAEVAELAGGAKPTYPYLVDSAAGVSMFESADICNHLLATYGPGVDELPAPAEYFLPSTLVTGWIPSLLRPKRGTSVEPGRKPPPAPAQLVLYSYEGNQFCRLVREALAELDLPYELRSTGKGSPRRVELAERSGGSTAAPFLVDDGAGVAMGESAEIVDYLWRTYGAEQ